MFASGRFRRSYATAPATETSAHADLVARRRDRSEVPQLSQDSGLSLACLILDSASLQLILVHSSS